MDYAVLTREVPIEEEFILFQMAFKGRRHIERVAVHRPSGPKMTTPMSTVVHRYVVFCELKSDATMVKLSWT